MAKPQYTNTSVSFPDEKILEEAKRRAAKMGISFSKYVVLLIEKDLTERQSVGSISDLVQHQPQSSSESEANSATGVPRRAVDSPENLEAMAKLGIVAAGIQPRARVESSPKAASTTGSKSAQPSPARRSTSPGSTAQAQAPRQSAPATSKSKHSSP